MLASHIRTVLSMLPEAILLPFGEYAMPLTPFV